jgi:hypothetical protein
MRWFAVCIFEIQPGDENREFETHVQLGHITSLPARFRFIPTARFHRVIHQLLGIPLVFGQVRLRVYAGPVGQAQIEIGDYPIEIQRAAAPGPVN